MENQSRKHSALSVLQALQMVVLTVVILYVGRPLFVPLGFALFLALVLYPGVRWLEQKGMNRHVAIGLPLVFTVAAGAALGYLIVVNLIDFSAELGQIRIRLAGLIHEAGHTLTDRFRVSAASQAEILRSIAGKLGGSIFDASGRTVSSLSEGLFFAVMVPVFSWLILSHRLRLANALHWFFGPVSQENFHSMVKEVIHSYSAFVKGMAVVYLSVGVLNSLGLYFIGVSHPVWFGFMASLLTFIPYVGIMVASVFPVSAAWIAYGSVWYPLAVIGWFTVVQMLEAYLIFPLVIGNRLKVNALVLFLMIIAGGMLWGAAGMILFIPLVSILRLLARRSPGLKALADLLGE